MLINHDRQTQAFFLSVISLISISTTAAAQPQPQADYTNALRVYITGTCRAGYLLPKEELFVVLNGNEQVPARLTPVVGTNGREWEGKWPPDKRSGKQFLAEGSVASARLRGYRTDCVSSDSKRHNDAPEAVFSLDCDQNPASDITVQFDPDSWSYKRSLKKTRDATTDCDERAGPNSGLREIWDVRLKKEVTRIGFKDPEKNLFWILLNNLPVIKKSGKGGSVTLDHDKVTDEIVRSNRQEQLAGNAYDTVRKHPKITPGTKLIIRVN